MDKACTKGHINPDRYKSGACKECRKEYNAINIANPNFKCSAKNCQEKTGIGYTRCYWHCRASNWCGLGIKLPWIIWTVPAAQIESWYQGLIIAQGGKCMGVPHYIVNCPMPPTDLEHDHDTGEVRGVACHPCNVWEGKLRKYNKRSSEHQILVPKQFGEFAELNPMIEA